MKTSLLPCLAAAAALTLLSSGCRTYDTEGEAYPATVSSAENVAPQVVVPSAEDVGKEGTYKEFVIPAEGGDQSYAIESEGLAGQTGRHVSPPPPEQESAAPAAQPAAAPTGNVYVVQNGDILGRIAIKYGTSVKAIMDANGIKDAKKLRVGQKLTIPAATAKPAATNAKAPAAPKAKELPAKAGYTTYLVQSGDILGRIANKNGTTVKALMEANDLSDPTKLRAGKYIYIPAAGANKVEAPAPEAKPAAPKKTSRKAAKPVVEEDDVEEILPPAPAPAAPAQSLDDLLDGLQ